MHFSRKLIKNSAIMFLTGALLYAGCPNVKADSLYLPLVGKTACEIKAGDILVKTGMITGVNINEVGDGQLTVEEEATGNIYILSGATIGEARTLAGLIGRTVDISGRSLRDSLCDLVELQPTWVLSNADQYLQREVQVCFGEPKSGCSASENQTKHLYDDGWLTLVDQHMYLSLCLMPAKGCKPAQGDPEFEYLGDGRYNIYTGL